MATCGRSRTNGCVEIHRAGAAPRSADVQSLADLASSFEIVRTMRLIPIGPDPNPGAGRRVDRRRRCRSSCSSFARRLIVRAVETLLHI